MATVCFKGDHLGDDGPGWVAAALWGNTKCTKLDLTAVCLSPTCAHMCSCIIVPVYL